MKIDTTLLATDLSAISQLTRKAEAIGFDGIWVSETAHDAFLPLVLAAEHSERVSLGTSIAVAFPRTPAILAHIAWDLAKYSQGRTVIGLGPQTNSHFQYCDAPNAHCYFLHSRHIRKLVKIRIIRGKSWQSVCQR